MIYMRDESESFVQIMIHSLKIINIDVELLLCPLKKR